MIIANAFGRRSAIFNKQAQYTRREFECSWAYLPKYNIWNISNIYHKNAWQLKEFADLFGLHFPAGINYSWLASTLRVAVCNSIRHFISVGRDSRITFHLLLFSLNMRISFEQLERLERNYSVKIHYKFEHFQVLYYAKSCWPLFSTTVRATSTGRTRIAVCQGDEQESSSSLVCFRGSESNLHPVTGCEGYESWHWSCLLSTF